MTIRTEHVCNKQRPHAKRRGLRVSGRRRGAVLQWVFGELFAEPAGAVGGDGVGSELAEVEGGLEVVYGPDVEFEVLGAKFGDDGLSGCGNSFGCAWQCGF